MHYTCLIQPQGPLIPVSIWISEPRLQALQKAGQAPPPIVNATLLIDTGASGTAIDSTVIAQLGIQPTGSIPIRTPSTGTTPHVCNTYDVGLVLPGATPAKAFRALPVIEGHFLSQGHHGLLGRDALAEGRLIYSGADGIVLLSF